MNFDAIVADAVRQSREAMLAKMAELLTAVNTKGIKSVQRFKVPWVGGQTSVSVTIAAVNVSKTEARLNGFTVGTSSMTDTFPTVELTSPTTVLISRQLYTASGTAGTVSVEVVEWN